MSNEILVMKSSLRKKRKKARRYIKLWRFVGKELGNKHNFNAEEFKDSKVRVQFISSEEMCDLEEKKREQELNLYTKLNKMSKEEFLEHLKQESLYLYHAYTSPPKEVNGSCFVIPYLKRVKQLQYLKTLPLPTKNPLDYEVLIYINKGNIERRRKEWSKNWNCAFSSEDVQTFLIIHEMIHAYSRLSEKFDALERDLKDSDLEASRLLWKWKKSNLEEGF